MPSRSTGQDLIALANRFVSSFTSQLKGARYSDIEKIKTIAKEVSPRPLPDFYLWFLEKMGTQMGALNPSGSRTHYSAQSIIAAYESGIFRRPQGYFLIGFVDGPKEETHLFLDLSREADGDAPLVAKNAFSSLHDPEEEMYLSLEESFAHRLFEYEHIDSFNCIQDGSIGPDPDSEMAHTATELDTILKKANFERLPITRMHCPMYFRKDISISLWTSPPENPNEGYSMRLGATSEQELARTLEIINDSIGWKFRRLDHIAK